MQIILYFIYRVKNRRYVRSMQGANKTINTKVGLDLPMSEQVRQRQVTLDEGKTLVNTKGVYGSKFCRIYKCYLFITDIKYRSPKYCISHLCVEGEAGNFNTKMR